MIRVFPQRTLWTPTDSLAFTGPPGMFRPEEQPVAISCTFTWDIPICEHLYKEWSAFYKDVEMGGPAFGDPGGEFTPGQFMKKGSVITSRGCTKECDFCFVPKREGWIRELEVKEGWDVADNNLLACSRHHIEEVFEMLRRQPERIKLAGGLDAEFLQSWHVDLLKTIRLKYAWFACDYPGAVKNLERAADLMSDFNRKIKRCYVLIGYNGESILSAEKRLEQVYRLGFLPMAMYYRDDSTKPVFIPKDWQRLKSSWANPALFEPRLKKKKEGEEDGKARDMGGRYLINI